ncbi:Small glutamine-rich tetratricopeptide repeat-containing protein [Hondaea fermentalgiana]|uniref:Small glutamine-rich tetratricopeptide repeat-containing protein n=1 Tax=Hondaea fermentalgiana TaxID=2315210 RepID=A0A2R5GB12_9STRA|nr:Small glutamine-rich tetratricopeptide repeat-containing protein [Hondaea fermentalgiana]|eukprot:GBG24884.1 Small glutamine-rich tetratricopeptide repeat-containing protein [Hondaea fermentalgiana]
MDAVEALKSRGNAAFLAKDLDLALELYSRGLETLGPPSREEDGGDSDETTKEKDIRLRCALLTNRANTRFLQKDYIGAVRDADEALLIDPNWEKAHFRKGQAYMQMGDAEKATQAYRKALNQGASTKAFAPLLRKAKEAATAKARATVQLYPERPGAARSKEEEEARRARGKIEQLKEMLKGGAKDADSLLDGLFSRMQTPTQFRQIVYRNAQLPPEAAARMPKSFQELVSNELYFKALVDLFPSIQAKADSVLQNVKAKGAKDGQFMDEATERMLRPQVLNEAFAHKVVDMIHEVNRQQNALLSQVEPLEASPDADEARLDQIGESAVNGLAEVSCGYGVVDRVLGGDEEESAEWVSLVRADVADLYMSGRFEPRDVADLTKSELAQAGEARNVANYRGPWSCWMDQSELAEDFEALAEVAQRLHAMPFELNRKHPVLHLRKPLANRVLIYILGDPAALVAEAEDDEDDEGDECEDGKTDGGSSEGASCDKNDQAVLGGLRARRDGGFGDKDNGFKISAAYFATNQAWSSENGGHMRVRSSVPSGYAGPKPASTMDASDPTSFRISTSIDINAVPKF